MMTKETNKNPKKKRKSLDEIIEEPVSEDISEVIEKPLKSDGQHVSTPDEKWFQNYKESDAWRIGPYSELELGLENINMITDPPVRHMEQNPGILGYSRRDGELRLTIAYNKQMIRHVTLRQFVELIENIDQTLLLSNFKESDRNFGSAPKGQLLCSLKSNLSCLVFVQGVVSRIVRNPQDIAIRAEYYINKEMLKAFFVTSKLQLENQNELDQLMTAYDGWLDYDIKDLCEDER
jgi:hypothetical protein